MIKVSLCTYNMEKNMHMIFFQSSNTVIKLGEGKDLGGCIMSGDRQLKQGKKWKRRA